MALSTTAKVASGVGVTSTAVAGAGLTYKYMNSGLYAIEKLALDEQAVWKVKSESSPDIVSVFAKSSENSLATKYGVENDGIWTCNLKISDSSKLADFKNKLKTYIGSVAIDNNEKSVTAIFPENKSNFLNSCAKNRKDKESSKSKVVSEIEIDYTKVDEKLKEIFGGFLNPVETKISSQLADLTFSLGSFASEPTTTPKKVKVTITAANVQNKNVLGGDESWSCTIEGIPAEGTDLTTVSDTSHLNTTLSGKITEEGDKWGLVNSCARNRTSDFDKKAVTSTLKLSVSKNPTEETKLKFDDSQITKVFSGTWKNQ